jgi:hypothetical protein
MNVGIGNKAAQFKFWESMNRILGTVQNIPLNNEAELGTVSMIGPFIEAYICTVREVGGGGGQQTK